MNEFVMEIPNGATWIRDCLLDSPEIVQACHRLNENSRKGIRHFSATRRAVPLEQARSVELELSRLEREEDRELRDVPVNALKAGKPRPQPDFKGR